MTVVFQLEPSQDPQRRLAFGCSPLAEAAFSLRVLVNPRRFRAHSVWTETWRRFPPGLRTEVRAHAPLFSRLIPGFLTATTAESATFEEELTRVEGLRANELRVEVREVLGRRIKFGSGRRALPGEDLARLELSGEWESDWRAAKARLLALLEEYWLVVFRWEWERIEPVLAKETRACAERVRLGLEVAPWTLVRLDAAGVTARRDCDEVQKIDLGERALTLAPSAFLWPRVSVESSPAWPFTVFYPIAPLGDRRQGEAAPDVLLPGLRALADGTRLRILRLLVERPRSTQELAQAVALSESAVSQHLRLLHAAGVVAGRRDGHYVLYSVAPGSVRKIAAALAALVRDERGRRDAPSVL